jgi:hypothetical protein
MPSDLNDICDAFPHPEHVDLTMPYLQAQSSPDMEVLQVYLGVIGSIQEDPGNLNRSFIFFNVHTCMVFEACGAFVNDRKATEVPRILILNATECHDIPIAFESLLISFIRWICLVS